MLQKIQQQYKFSKKRDKHLITPCCNKSNDDLKFVNYHGLPKIYGYCHSCGESTLPPTTYIDDSGNEYYWNEGSNSFEPNVIQLYDKIANKCITNCNTNINAESKKLNFIDFKIVNLFYNNNLKNNLIEYLRSTYGKGKANSVIQMYHLGTSKDSGAVFWYINKDYKVQKAKIAYYNSNGKRTKYFKVPYKNEDGFYSCLFGEHLLELEDNRNKSIILVESEKTALVCAMLLPDFVWLAYSGINGLTKEKIKVLTGRKIIIVPDMSSKAVEIMNSKLELFKELDIQAKIWDMTEGRSDEQLKRKGVYNSDLEDVFRSDKSKKTQ